MSWRTIVAASMTVAAVTSACANDARLLYDRDVPEPGTGAGDVTPPPPSGGTGPGGIGGFRFPVGSGGEEPPPPLTCPPVGEDVCTCAPFDFCLCEPQPMMDPNDNHCSMFCPEGPCGMDCGFATTCDMFCESDCQLSCPPLSTCMIICGGGCEVLCEPDSYCVVDPQSGPTVVICAENAICECVDPMTCSCEGPGCPPTP